ncbi:MAG: hypothetical protein RI953_1696, partial [Pseudomonadota bacterium]
MSRVLHSDAGELKRIKNGSKDTLSTLLIGAATSLLVTGVLIENTFSGGLPEWIKLTGRSVYWHQFKHIETQEGLLRLSDKEIKELSQFVATWRSHEGLHSLYFWTAIGVACLSILLWVWMRTWLCANSKLSEQVREGEQSLVSSKALSKLIRKAVENPARPHSFREHDVILGRQKIRVCNETMGLHLGIGGASQTGKTNAINQVLQSRRLAGEKVLIVDPGGEFYARFGRTGDVILSLHDTRAVIWDFWSEGVSEEEMAKALVEVREGMDASTKFFQTTGRAVLTSLFRIAGKDSEPLRELW